MSEKDDREADTRDEETRERSAWQLVARHKDEFDQIREEQGARWDKENEKDR